jgi:Asp-tRNA(Asn)/Glu-tRNA(Gln) amidotransferase A subunit family amidase
MRSPMSELPATLTGLQRALSRRELSCAEALAAQRQRLALLDRDHHCVVQAFAAQDSRLDGGGTLAGVGLAHKDIFDTQDRLPGVGHGRGSLVRGLRPATAVTRLQSHGAANMAALAMAEYACGATGENSRFERCVNPLSAQAVVGGSSSGSAVAVASEMAYGSLGTDTAGSVRIPAATCALLGLKTTRGLIPVNGVHPLARSLDSVGILTRSAADAVQLLDAAANVELLRPAAGAPPRIKAWLPEADLHAGVAAALEEFARDCGVTQRISQWPDYQTLADLADIVLHAESANTHHTALIEGTASAAVRAVALAGLAIPHEWYGAALAGRAGRARAFVEEHLRLHDMLLLPALPHPVPDWRTVSVGSPDFEARQLLALHRYMGFVNYLGFPSLVIPIARDTRGLPISVQLIARPFHERTLLAFAGTVEARRFGAGGFTHPFFSKG